MAGIKIDFVANVGKFIGGTKDVEKALENVSGNLDEVAQDATAMERKFTDSMNTVKAQSRSAGDAIGTNVRRGTKQATQGFDDVRKEAAASARGAATSFRGGFEDIAQFGQELAAQAFAGLGPAGAAAGLAAAVGIGLIVSNLQDAAQKANKAKEETLTLAQAIYDAGGAVDSLDWNAMFKDFATGVADSKEWFEFWQKDFTSNLEYADNAARDFGLNFKDVFRGLAGDSQAGERALADVNMALIQQQRVVRDSIAVTGQATVADMDREQGLIDLQAKLEAATKKTNDAKRAAELLTEVTGTHTDAIKESRKAIDEWNQAQDEKLRKLRKEANENISLAEAQQAWAEQQMEAKDALKEVSDATDKSNKRTREATDAVLANRAGWDLMTTAGQLANEATIDIAKSGWDLVEALRAAGAGADEQAAANEAARLKLIETAFQMGLTQEAAEDLADKYLPLKGELVATARLDTTAADLALEALLERKDRAMSVEPSGTKTTTNNVTINVPTTVTQTFDSTEVSRQIAWSLPMGMIA